jgi:hypothetical protein
VHSDKDPVKQCTCAQWQGSSEAVYLCAVTRIQWSSVPVRSDKDPVKQCVPVHSDKDPVKDIRNNYVKHNSGIKEDSWQSDNRSHTHQLWQEPVNRIAKECLTNGNKDHKQTNKPHSQAEPYDFNATPNQAM